MSGSRTFPADFVFGVATSAYQVEGHIENDWSEWERAGKLKEPHARCGRGVDHWNRFDEDLGLVKAVGATAFRISLEWARIEPEPGKFDREAVERYRERLLAMKAAGVRPVVTLHHFTHPTWFAKVSPWHTTDCLEIWRRYAKVCAELLEGLDALVITFNEPMVLLFGGYIARAMLALANLVRCHVIAREEIRARSPNAELGISQNTLVFAPERAWHPLDRAVARMASWNYNHALLSALVSGKLRLQIPGTGSINVEIEGARDSTEFVGMNYYTRAHIKFITRKPFIVFGYRDPSKRGLTDIGWEEYPEGFGQMLLEMKRYKLPVWVTENGIDDRQGHRRSSYLHDHWQRLLDARDRGVDVRGYLYWSLLDNFEWLEGWGPRFGLYRVDFETLERTPTPACDYFRQVAVTRQLVAPSPTALG
jgi:beta-glucosidase